MSLQIIREEKAVSQAAGFPGDPRGLQEEHGALSAIGRSRALYQRWASHLGVGVLDGIGMTEMLHIFWSGLPGAVRPGTTGVAVPGYDPRILDEGNEVAPGIPGMLLVRGGSGAAGAAGNAAATSGQC